MFTWSLIISWWLSIMISNLSQRVLNSPTCSIPPPATDRSNLFFRSASANSGSISGFLFASSACFALTSPISSTVCGRTERASLASTRKESMSYRKLKQGYSCLQIRAGINYIKIIVVWQTLLSSLVPMLHSKLFNVACS